MSHFSEIDAHLKEQIDAIAAERDDYRRRFEAGLAANESMLRQLQEERREKELYKATAFAAQNKVKLLWGENERLKVRLAEVHEI